jgi:hypothetical protein
MHSLLHVSVYFDHPQEAYADPCWTYTFVELSVKYIVKRFAALWQHVLQAVVCIECRTECESVYLVKFTLVKLIIH